MTPESTS